MDIKAIAHNLMTHGVYGTYQIYEKRKAVRLKEELNLSSDNIYSK